MMTIIFKQSKLNGRNNMAWVATDANGQETIFEFGDFLYLPKGSIKKLIGRDLDWNDEPVELKEE